MKKETINKGIEFFGSKEKFEKWLYTDNLIMGKKPINSTDEEIQTQLDGRSWGII